MPRKRPNLTAREIKLLISFATYCLQQPATSGTVSDATFRNWLLVRPVEF